MMKIGQERGTAALKATQKSRRSHVVSSQRHGGVVGRVMAMSEQSKSLEIMRKFSEQYAKRWVCGVVEGDVW